MSAKSRTFRMNPLFCIRQDRGLLYIREKDGSCDEIVAGLFCILQVLWRIGVYLSISCE